MRDSLALSGAIVRGRRIYGRGRKIIVLIRRRVEVYDVAADTKIRYYYNKQRRAVRERQGRGNK